MFAHINGKICQPETQQSKHKRDYQTEYEKPVLNQFNEFFPKHGVSSP
jgi:hypothetical protein